METQSTYMNLPIMKHFSEGEISSKVDKFRKGEKGLFWFLKLGALIGLGYLTWVYVLPPLFLAIGQFLAVAATGILLVGLIIAMVFVCLHETCTKQSLSMILSLNWKIKNN